MKLLVIDDEKKLRSFIKMHCEGVGYDVTTAAGPSEALERFAESSFDIAIVDVMMPGMDGLTLMRKLKEMDPNLDVIIITAHGSIETAVNAMRDGAADFLSKPFGIDELQASLERTTRLHDLGSRLRKTEFDLAQVCRQQDSSSEYTFVGESLKIRELLALTDNLALSDHTNVLITGESGTGKELIARRLHKGGNRADKPFHAVNCAAIVDTLFESEFFGHRKGAFTGAVADQPGWFERASGSTLFLDEITEIPQHLQAKLLRVIEERTVTRVGETKPRPVDVRIVSSSNQPIEEIVKQGKFRADLYYRLGGFQLHLPPLRERPGDIPLICEHFLRLFSVRIAKKITGISTKAMDSLRQYAFPGNVRELRNLVERAIILTPGTTITEFPLTKEHKSEDLPCYDLKQVEANTIKRALVASGNNKTHAAALLGIQWQVLHRKMQRLKIDPDKLSD